MGSKKDKYDLLRSQSIMFIGERYPNRVVWLQLHMTESFEEELVRDLMYHLSQHIASGSAPSGSARKFLDGKLIYYEVKSTGRPRVYAIYTRQVKNIYSDVKKAVQAVASRGGVYSAQRFFTEFIEILDNPERLDMYDTLNTNEALNRLNDDQLEDLDLNELGLLISHLNNKVELDQLTLEKIYFHIYQVIQEISDDLTEKDPDEFLDAAYLIAQRYQETDSFHLALELYKHIIPVARRNDRYDLEAACRIQIGTIYKRYFPMSGEYILDTLGDIQDLHLSDTNNRMLEIYHCLLGHAYTEQGKEQLSIREYQAAIDVAEQDINSPQWISEAYFHLGLVDQSRHYLKDAIRHYLTAASIAFSYGDLSRADNYRHAAAEAELNTAQSIIHMSLIHRMEMDHRDAEYRAWEALRLLTKAYLHCMPDQYVTLQVMAEEVLFHARIILRLPGKEKKNREILNSIQKTLQELTSKNLAQDREQNKLERINKLIEENIPLAPPTFMLLTIDGRLMTMGKITDEGWEKSEIEGTLLSGVLSAIMSLMSEVSEDTSSLRTIDAGNFQIMIEQSSNIMAVLLVDRDIQEFRKRLIRLLEYIDSKFGDRIISWDGGTLMFRPLQEKAQEMLAPSIVAANIDD